MTLDQLIEIAMAMKLKHGGSTEVGCWPYDGQWLCAATLEGVRLREYVDVNLSDNKDKPDVRTFLMLED